MNDPRRREAPSHSGERLRLIVHDYGGYPFVVQLSRALAAREHEVLHLYAAGFRRPFGPVARLTEDPPTISLAPLTLTEPLYRGGIRRISQERRYGRLLAAQIQAFRPHVVLSANSPLDVQAAAAAQTHAVGAAFVFWLQDLHSQAITRIIGRKHRLLGSLAGARFRRLEQTLLRESERIIAISAAFLPLLGDWGVPPERVEVIENWAPIEAGPAPARTNRWSLEHGLSDRPILLYSGTLALKHNPGLLLALARGLPQATVLVASEGPGADWLRNHAGESPNLHVLPFQPYDRVTEMLASADVLVAVLEPDASTFSAPSKILTYLAAGRAILAAVPAENPAAAAIEQSGGGSVVDPTDPDLLVEAARRLLANPDRLQAAGAAGLTYARAKFDIKRIADRFEAALTSAVGRKSHFAGEIRADTSSAEDMSYGEKA